jgi:hypothetical protein
MTYGECETKYGVQNRNNISHNLKALYVSEDKGREVVPVHIMKAYCEWRYKSTHS